MSVALAACFQPVPESICDPSVCNGDGGHVGGGGGSTLGGGAGGGSGGGATTGGGGQLGGGSGGGTGGGAGPDIEVTPAASLDLGPVIWFANSAIIETGQLTLRNVGTGSLKLGLPDGAGGYRAPYWTVGGPNASDFCVGEYDRRTDSCTNALAPNSYDAVTGLGADGSSLTVPVHFKPTGLGVRTAQLNFPSNDPDEPITTITLTGNGVPDCIIEITPMTALDFGVMSSGTKELSHTIHNRRTGPNDLCVIWDLRVETLGGAGITFSTPGSSMKLVLAPDERRIVTVRATVAVQPTSSPTRVIGALRYEHGSGGKLIPLLATLAQP